VRTQSAGDVIVKLADATIPGQQVSVDSSGRLTLKLNDGSGNSVTSTLIGTHQSLDSNVTQIATTSDKTVSAALAALNATASLTTNGTSGGILQLAGTWVGTIVVEASNDGGTTWSALDLLDLPPNGANALVASVAANGDYLIVGVSTWAQVRARMSAFTSGSATAQINLSQNGFEKLALQTNPANLKTQAWMNDGAGTALSSSSIGGLQSLAVTDGADGPVAPGTVASKSMLAGGQYSSTLPVLTTGQQAAMQVDSSGRILVANPASAVANLNATVRLQDGAGNAITSTTAGSKQTLDVDLRDGSGNAYTTSNPLPVVVSQNIPGTNINKYNTTVALALASSTNHIYTITTGKTFTGKKFWISASGKVRADIKTSPDGATYTTYWTAFNSVAEPNITIDMDLLSITDSGTGSTIEITITNDDVNVFDVFSTISGVEN